MVWRLCATRILNTFGWRRLVGLGVACPCLAYPRAPAPAYWRTSSASTRRCGGIVIHRAFAVLRLMTNSNFIGCSIGKSDGLYTYRILSTLVASRRKRSGRIGPEY